MGSGVTEKLKEWVRLPPGLYPPHDVASEETRKVRRLLLAVCTVGLSVDWLGFRPSEVSLLGLRGSIENPRALDWVLVLVILYGLSSFIVYSSSDFGVAWRKMYQSRQSLFRERAYDSLFPETVRYDPEKEVLEDEARWIGLKEFGRFLVGPRFALLRWGFDYGLPYFYSLWVMAALVRA